MLDPADKVQRARAKAEAQFKREEDGKAVLASVEREAASEREKTTRLRAERLAKAEADRVEGIPVPSATKPRKVAPRVRRGISSA